MNIVKEIKLTEDRPVVYPIKKTKKLNLFAVGLMGNQILKKHKTNVPTLLTVIKGKIEFEIENKIDILETYDVYQIPVNIEHEVKGLNAENVFTLTQEK